MKIKIIHPYIEEFKEKFFKRESLDGDLGEHYYLDEDINPQKLIKWLEERLHDEYLNGYDCGHIDGIAEVEDGKR